MIDLRRAMEVFNGVHMRSIDSYIHVHFDISLACVQYNFLQLPQARLIITFPPGEE